MGSSLSILQYFGDDDTQQEDELYLQTTLSKQQQELVEELPSKQATENIRTNVRTSGHPTPSKQQLLWKERIQSKPQQVTAAARPHVQLPTEITFFNFRTAGHPKPSKQQSLWKEPLQSKPQQVTGAVLTQVQLPTEMLLHIVSFVDLPTLVTFRKVNRLMHQTFEKELFKRMSNRKGKKTSIAFKLYDPNRPERRCNFELRYIGDTNLWSREYANKSRLIQTALQKYSNPSLPDGGRYEDYQINYRYSKSRAWNKLSLGDESPQGGGIVTTYDFIPNRRERQKARGKLPYVWSIDTNCYEEQASYQQLRNSKLFVDEVSNHHNKDELDAFKYCLVYLLSNYSLCNKRLGFRIIDYSYNMTKTPLAHFVGDSCVQMRLRKKGSRTTTKGQEAKCIEFVTHRLDPPQYTMDDTLDKDSTLIRRTHRLHQTLLNSMKVCRKPGNLTNILLRKIKAENSR